MSSPYGRYNKTTDVGRLQPSADEQRRQEAIASTLNSGFPWLDSYSGEARQRLAADFVDMLDAPLMPFEAQLEAYRAGTLDLTVVAGNVARNILQRRLAQSSLGVAAITASQIHVVVEQPEAQGPLIEHIYEIKSPVRQVG